MAAANLAQMLDVDIDCDSVFKYVLIQVHVVLPSGALARESKEIVSGYKWVSVEMQKGYDCECLGRGCISHQSQGKKIHVYGYSMGYTVAPSTPSPLRRSKPGTLHHHLHWSLKKKEKKN
uniref:14 kDa phosphohistidine phosphatase n=1 Tax=Monodon monoceros TaxID=40151 RepID=A0A8C6B8F8_MONMO